MERRGLAERENVGFPVSKTLEAFRANPKDNWSMADIERLCSEVGLSCVPPSKGSHYKIKSSVAVRWILTIPKARPIKPPYVRQLVQFADEHLAAIREAATGEKDTIDER